MPIPFIKIWEKRCSRMDTGTMQASVKSQCLPPRPVLIPKAVQPKQSPSPPPPTLETEAQPPATCPASLAPLPWHSLGGLLVLACWLPDRAPWAPALCCHPFFGHCCHGGWESPQWVPLMNSYRLSGSLCWRGWTDTNTDVHSQAVHAEDSGKTRDRPEWRWMHFHKHMGAVCSLGLEKYKVI